MLYFTRNHGNEYTVNLNGNKKEIKKHEDQYSKAMVKDNKNEIMIMTGTATTFGHATLVTANSDSKFSSVL